jgi:hypothetical protein
MSEVTMVGKTIAGVNYANSTYKGFTLLFTDGTELNIYERTQSGEIVVTYEGQFVESEGEDD